MALIGGVGASPSVRAAVALTSTCPVVGLGGLIAGDAAGPSALETTLSQPYGIAIDQTTGTVYVSERNWDTGTYTSTGQGRIRRITQAGAISDLPPGPAGERLGHLAINLAGTTLYVATTHATFGDRVYAVDLTLPTPTWTLFAGGGTDFLGNGVPATSARFLGIDDIEVSPLTGLLYISGVSQDAGPPIENVGIVREVDGAGIIRTVVGGLTDLVGSNAEGVAARTARVPFSPVTVAFDGAGVMSLGAIQVVRRIPPDAGANPYGDGLITTFAGSNGGAGDVTGDGGPAATARFGAINAMAADSAGNLYLGGAENHTVRRIDTVGNVSTYVGETGAASSDAGIAGFQDDGNASSSRLAFTEEMSIYGSDLFVVDARNNRVRRVALNQAPFGPSYVTTFAGRGPNLVDETGPALTRHTGLVDGVSVGADGSVYFADRLAYRVWRRSPDGVLTAIAGTGSLRGLVGTVPLSGTATSVPLSIVRDVAVSPDPQTPLPDPNTLYVLERTRVLAVDLSTGVLSVLAGSGAIGQADGIGVGATLDTGAGGTMAIGGGYLYVSGAGNRIRRISLAGPSLGTVDTPAGPLGAGILSLEYDGAGGLFIGTSDHFILHWDGAATQIVAGGGVFGRTGDGGPASAALVGSPTGLTLLDRPGTDDVLYFANQGRQIRAISAGSGSGAARWASGIVDLVAGNINSSPIAPGDWGDGRDLSADKTLTRFRSIRDMDVDGQGRLFINDADLSDANPANRDATNTGPHMIRVLTDKGCAEASLGGPPTAPTATSGGVPLATLPIGQIPFDTAAIAATPMRAVPMRASELDSTPMRASPMRAVPMRAVPMRASGLANTPMRASSLSAFPLDPVAYPGGWPERLAGTPLEGRLPQHIDFSELLDDPATTAVDETSPALTRSPEVTLASIDIANSPMRAVSIASIALGSTPMRAVPMRASLIGATDAQRFQAWCDLLTDPAVPEISQLGYTCASLGLTQDSPLLALDIASVPMRAVPMRAVPMRAVDISASPMRAVPMRASGIEPNPMRASPMRAVPMRAVLVGSAPMRAVPLDSIPMRASELAALNLADSPMRAVQLSLLGAGAANVASCYPGCQTLGEAADQSAILPTATLGDLIPALDAALTSTGAVPKLGDLRWGNAVFAGLDKNGDNVIDSRDEVDLGDIIPFLPEDPFISLADVLSGFIGAQDLPWDDISLDAMGVTSLASGSTASLSFTFRLYPGQAATIPVTVTLPPGWRYAATDSLVVDPDAGIRTNPAPPTPTVSLEATTSVQTVSYVIPAALPAPSTVGLNVRAYPGNRLGTFQASGSVGPVIANGVTQNIVSNPMTVRTNEQGTDGYDFAETIQADRLYVRHLDMPGDTDYYRLDAGAPGAITRISLSHLPVDADLVVYEEDPQQFNFRASVAALRPKLPQQSKPVEMSDPSGKLIGEALEPAELQDLPLEPGKVVAATSARRGTNVESVELINDNPGVDYVVAVHGYNNASSPDPYVLRAHQINPPGSSQCSSSDIQLPGLPGGYTVTPASGPIPAGTQTLLLANRERLTREFGTTDANALLGQLDAFATRSDVKGHVVLVDGSAGVRSAYSAWDLNPCGLGRPNLVVRAINDSVDALLGPTGSPARSTVQNLVVIGGDEQIPMARLIDNTELSNEVEYGAELRRPNPTPPGAPISTPQTVALASRSLLSDDPYAALEPKLFGPDVVYPPDLSIGRLVETPAEIGGVLTQFGASTGRLAPDSALVTGYGFLSDGAQGVRDGLAGAVPPEANRDGSLINDTWTAGGLTAKVVTPTDPADLISLNAHFDHHRLLPAEGDANPGAPLFGTGDLPAPPPGQPGRLAGRVVFSMGCHSGTGAPDFYLGSSGGDALDWPQVMAQQRAVWVANSGFGYGDTEVVAYSERLMTTFATRLGNGERAGEAMRLAKQDYLGSGIANSYDAKALTQIIYYGLPMYRVGSGSPTPPPPAFVATVADPRAGGLASHTTTVDPQLSLQTADDSSQYIAAIDPSEPTALLQQQTQVVDGRPIQPRVDVDVTAQGLVARGAVLDALTMTSQPLTVTIARPVVDSSAREPAIPGIDSAYPSTFQNVTAFEDARGDRNNLVLIPGQFLPDASAATRPNVGTQRSFTSLTSTVYYAAPGDTDDIQPIISATSGSASGGGVTFRATAADATRSGAGAVRRVSVLYLDGATWRSTELAQTAPGEFVGGGAASNSAVDYLVQAVDASGNVAVSSNKAILFTSGAAPSPGPGINGAPIVTGPSGATGTAFQPVVFTGSFSDPDTSSAWFGTVNDGAGATTQLTVTGNGFTATLPGFATSGSYTATVSVCDGEGACGTTTVPITVGGTGIGPTADCTVFSAGQALTWWGTQSSQATALPMPIGPGNAFSPAPIGRGQPTVIDPGSRQRIFATASPPGSRSSWLLGGSSIQALTARGCA